MNSTSPPAVLTFDRLVPGRELGRHAFECTAEAIETWRAIYPELPSPAAGRVPPGIAAVIAITAYARVTDPRPEGNVHGSQRFRWRRLPRVGERVETAVRVKAAEVRNGRRWVTVETLTTDAAGRPVLEGEMVTLWAR
jgi:hypothetical protein